MSSGRAAADVLSWGAMPLRAIGTALVIAGAIVLVGAFARFVHRLSALVRAAD